MTHVRILFTIGYESKTKSTLLALLHEHGIQRVVDVRRYNNVNVFPNNPWCKTNLIPILREVGIAYDELKCVAPSRNLLSDEKYGVAQVPCDCRSAKQCAKAKIHLRQSLTPEKFEARYLQEIHSNGGIGELIRFFQDHEEEKLVLLCFEAEPNECHRLTLVEELLRTHPGAFHTVHL